MGIKKGINKSLTRFCINCLKRAYLSAHSMSRVIYDRIQNKEIYFEISVNWMWTTNVKIRKIQCNVILPSNWFVCLGFVFIWISYSWSSLFEIQKGRNVKIYFSVLYPIIYNPHQLYFNVSISGLWFTSLRSVRWKSSRWYFTLSGN